MSLKTDYFDGLTGLHQNLNNAFNAGVAFVGTGVTEISSLDLGDRSGANIGSGVLYTLTVTAADATAGDIYSSGGNNYTVQGTISAGTTLIVRGYVNPGASGTLTKVSGSGDASIVWSANSAAAQAGIYFDVDGLGVGYRLWMYVSNEIAPSSGGRQLVQVTIANAATRAEAAESIMDALVALSGSPFNVSMIGDSLRIETSAPKTISNHISLSSGWGSAVVAVVQNGSDATGNFSTIRSALLNAAANGTTSFVVTLTATLNPSGLRANKGNNLLLKAHLAGIQKGLSDQQLYEYEVTPSLNITDSIDTKIDLNFHFQVS